MASIFLFNVGVYLIWQLDMIAQADFMQRHFLVSWQAVMAGRWWTLLTSIFSHADFFHLFLNLYFLYSFGGILESLMGQKRFFRFFLGAGLLGSLAHILTSAWLWSRPEVSALGASGALSGLLVLFCCLFPREKLYFFGLVPIPAIWGMLLFFGLDTWGFIRQGQGLGLPIGHAAHLGGALFGLGAYFIYFRPRHFTGAKW